MFFFFVYTGGCDNQVKVWNLDPETGNAVCDAEFEAAYKVYARMCIECVLLLQNVFSYNAVCDAEFEAAYKVFARMCSLTTECVL